MQISDRAHYGKAWTSKKDDLAENSVPEFTLLTQLRMYNLQSRNIIRV